MNFEDKDLADEDFSEIDSLCFYTTGEESIGDDLLSHYSIDDNVDGKRHLTGVEEDYYSFLLEKDLSPIKATFTDDNISCEYSETISVPPYQHSELYMTLNYEDPATTLKMIKRTYTHDKNAAFIDGQNFLKSMRLKFDADFFVDELQQRAISCYSALAIAHYFLVRDILPVIVYPDHMLDRKVFHFSPSTMKLYEELIEIGVLNFIPMNGKKEIDDHLLIVNTLFHNNFIISRDRFRDQKKYFDDTTPLRRVSFNIKRRERVYFTTLFHKRSDLFWHYELTFDLCSSWEFSRHRIVEQDIFRTNNTMNYNNYRNNQFRPFVEKIRKTINFLASRIKFRSKNVQSLKHTINDYHNFSI